MSERKTLSIVEPAAPPRRTLYQLHAINELTKARFKSRIVFGREEAAKAYMEAFRTRCLARDRSLPADCPIVIAELELEE
jgi:hypothetical protein